MRFAEEGNLLEHIQNNGVITEGHAKVWFRQMCLGLQYLHHLNIAHRDLKCENILITRNFNLKIADFGFARYVVDRNNRAILSETYCGSLSYAAPEIIDGRPYAPKASDIWSLGVILYVMVNESMPFNDNNIRKMYNNQISRNWGFRTKFKDQLSDNIKNLLRMMLEPEISLRYDIDEILKCSWYHPTKTPETDEASGSRDAEKRRKTTPKDVAVANIHRQARTSTQNQFKHYKIKVQK